MRRSFSMVALAAVVAGTAGVSVSHAQNAAGSPTFGNRTDRPDGSATMTIGRNLPTPWNTKFGFDANLAPEPAPDHSILQGAQRSTGAVWGSMSGPSLAPMIYDKTEIGARLDPSDDQGRVAATLSRTVPLADGLSVSLRDEYAVSRGGSAAEGSHASAAWSIDRSVRLNLGATGTTLSAGTTTSSADTQWHNRLSAEQKIAGPFSVSTSVTDPGTAASSKSITAGFRHTW